MDQISVLLIEDELALSGLLNYLSKELYINVVGQTTRQEQGIELAKHLTIDVVLISTNPNNMLTSIQTTAEITKFSNSKVIILTDTAEEDAVYEALKEGAIDCIVATNYEEIPATIRVAYHEVTPIGPHTAKKVRQEFIRLRDVEQQFVHMKSLLTPTEIDILYFIYCGHSQKDISHLLFVSLRTVKNHVCNILRKTGEKSSLKAAQKVKEFRIFSSQLK